MAKAHKTTQGFVLFYCPGCKTNHTIRVLNDGYDHDNLYAWSWNNDLETPTFSPSVLIKTGHHASTHKEGEDCWCNFEERFGKRPGFKCGICHSYVRDGKIEFLDDCTHALAGQTVDLPDFTY